MSHQVSLFAPLWLTCPSPADTSYFWGGLAEGNPTSWLLQQSCIFSPLPQEVISGWKHKSCSCGCHHSTEPKYSSTALISAGKNINVLHATGYTPGCTPGDSLRLPGLSSTHTHASLALAHLCVWTYDLWVQKQNMNNGNLSLFQSLLFLLAQTYTCMCIDQTQQNLWGSGLTLQPDDTITKLFCQGCLLLGHFSVSNWDFVYSTCYSEPDDEGFCQHCETGSFLFSLARTPTVLSAAAWACGFWRVTSEKQLCLEAEGRSWLPLWPRPKFQSHVLMNACWSNCPVWRKKCFRSPAMPS